jgi:hypothetical protein
LRELRADIGYAPMNALFVAPRNSATSHADATRSACSLAMLRSVIH